MKKQLTFARLKNTKFLELYERLYKKDEISIKEKYKILALSILFLNQSDINLQRFGYRIIVLYTNKTNDYKPLYDITINSGLFPISKQIEKITKLEENNFIRTFCSSYLETYESRGIYISAQQEKLNSFFSENMNNSVAIVAPTSYGKSDLIIKTIELSIKDNICIIVPSKALISQTKKRILNSNITEVTKIITHPDMYSEKDTNIKCILTQERLLRLLKN